MATGGQHGGCFAGEWRRNIQPAVTHGSGGDPAESVVVADVNGDGRADLLVSNNGSSNIGVLLGNGDGTFQPVTTYCSGGYFEAAGTGGGLAVADVNGDGKPDLLMASCAANGIDGVVGVLLGNGDGTFQSAVTYGSGMCGDDKPDLAVTSPGSNTVGVLLGKGDGTFQAAVAYGSGDSYPEAGGCGCERRRQARPDCDQLWLQHLPTWLSGRAAGQRCWHFQPPLGYDSGALNATSVVVADLNRHSRPDLVVANYYGGNGFFNGSVGVLLNNVFPSTQLHPLSPFPLLRKFYGQWTEKWYR